MDLQIIDCCICHKQIEPERTESGEIYWTQGMMPCQYTTVDVVTSVMQRLLSLLGLLK